MKQIFLSLSAFIMLAFVSCNGNESAKETPLKAGDTATAATKAPGSNAFQPFTIALIRHKVKDFDKWLPMYEGHDSARQASGLTEYGLGRGQENNNEVTVAFKVADMQKAKDFMNSPGLKEAMQKGGVTGPPSIAFLNVIRDDNSSIATKDRLMVIHHVKDFDAWLKVFDGEGKEARAGYGMIDRGIARGVDDPNMVYVLFAVSDPAKAKARSESPELKKLMADAGVDGPPTINAYTLVK